MRREATKKCLLLASRIVDTAAKSGWRGGGREEEVARTCFWAPFLSHRRPFCSHVCVHPPLFTRVCAPPSVHTCVCPPSFRIFSDEDFSPCAFKGSHFNGGSDGTFGEGKVVPDDWNGRGQLQAMTVLAYCDVAAGLAAKNDYNVGEAKRIAQARKVDKAQFLDDFKSGLFESTAFAHVEQVDKGRVGEDCRDDNPNGPA